jgi:hypothetical protein
MGNTEGPKTTTKDNDLNPNWNEYFALEVYNRDLQPLIIEMFDEDIGLGIDGDDPMGTAQTRFNLLAPNEHRDLDLKLQEVEKGTIQLQIMWVKAPFGTPPDRVPALKENGITLLKQKQWTGAVNNAPIATDALTSTPDTCGFRGILLKQRHGIHGSVWIKRYIVVENGSLVKYEDDLTSEYQRNLPLTSAIISKKEHDTSPSGAPMFVMQINWKDVLNGHPYKLRIGASSDEEYTQLESALLTEGATPV